MEVSMSMVIKIRTVVAICWLFLESAEAQQVNDALQHAIALSDSGIWEGAVIELNRLLDAGVLSQDEQTMARKVLGLTYISLGQKENAVKVFKEIVRYDEKLDANALGDKAPSDAILSLGQAIMEVRQEETAQRTKRPSRVVKAQEAGAALQHAIALPDSGKWERAVAELNYLLRVAELSQEEQTTARNVLGLTYIQLGQGGNAVTVFKEMVRDDPSLNMNTLLGDKPSVEAIRYLGQAALEVRQQEIEARQALLGRLSRGGSFIRSAVLPGWGQRYFRYNSRGYLMAGMAVASITYAVITERDYRKAQDRYRDAPEGSPFEDLYEKYDRKGDVADLAFGIVGSVWLLNVIDAVIQGPNLALPGLAVIQGPNLVEPGLALTTPATHDGLQLVYLTRF
jgi:tetratricopeptide (TPR) repeat protein